MNRVLAALHSVDVDTVGLSDYGKPGNYYARQIGRWTKQYRASETETVADMEALIEWLPDNIPGGERPSPGAWRLSTGQYDLPPNRTRIIGILDWELSAGRLADRLSINGVAIPTRRRHRRPGRIDRSSLGLPSDEDYIAAYCQRTGRTGIDNWPFYMAFCFFRIAAILQGIGARMGPLRAPRQTAARLWLDRSPPSGPPVSLSKFSQPMTQSSGFCGARLRGPATLRGESALSALS